MAGTVGYEEWTGNDWSFSVNGNSYDNELSNVRFRESVSSPLDWSATLRGVNSSSNDFSEGNVVELTYAGNRAFKGVIRSVDRSSNIEVELSGLGLSLYLLRTTYTDDWTGTNTTTIVSEVVGSTMNVGTNTSLDGSADFRMDEEAKLDGLNRLANDYNGEWWVDEGGSGNTQFNIDTQRGGGSSVKTFTTEGDGANAALAKKRTNSIDGGYDGVVVKGYGDGDDQIVASAGSTGDDDDVLVVVDKTIISSSEAQSRADTLNSDRGGTWTEIEIVPGNPDELFGIGDVVTVDSSDADVSSTDFRIVERTYKIDFEGFKEVSLVCSNKPQTFYSDDARQREETKSQTQYMQGARNVWAEKETGNSTSVEGLTIDFQLPNDVIDLTGANRTNSILLNYSCGPFRNTSTDSSSTVAAISPSTSDRADNNSNDDKDDYDTDVSANGGVTMETTDVEAPTMDNNDTTTWGTSYSESFFSVGDAAGFTSHTISGSDILNTIPITASEVDSSGHFLSVEVDNLPVPCNVSIRIDNPDTGELYYFDTKRMESVGGVSDDNHLQFSTRDDRLEDVVDNNESVRFGVAVDAGTGGSHGLDVQFVVFLCEKHTHPLQSNAHQTTGNDAYENTAVDDVNNTLVFDTDFFFSQTVDNVGSTPENRLTTVNDDVLTGNTADNVQIVIDGTDRTNDIYGSSNSGTNQDSDIDITDYLDDTTGDGKPDTGWHTIEIIPNQPTFLKGRVFADHHKDST